MEDVEDVCVLEGVQGCVFLRVFEDVCVEGCLRMCVFGGVLGFSY